MDGCPGLVAGLVEQVQIVDTGGLDRFAGLGCDVGVDVAGDGVRAGLPHRPALVLHFDHGQVERDEQQIDGAPDQGGVHLVPVAMQGYRRERGDLALLPPQKRPAQSRRVRPRRRGATLEVVTRGRGGPGLGMHTAVIVLVHPGAEQPVQLGQRGHRAAALPVGGLDFDQELVPHGAVPPFDLAPALRPARLRVHQPDVQHRQRPAQLGGNVGRAVVGIQPAGTPVGLDRIMQRGLHAQGLFPVAPPVPHRIPRVVIEQSEQHRPAPRHDGPVQPVRDPEVIRSVGFEPAKHRRHRPIRADVEPEPGEQALHGARRGRPPPLLGDDPHDVRGGASRTFPLQALGQLQHPRVGARRYLPLGRQQRVEPTSAPRPNPAIQAGPRHPHRLPKRTGMHPAGQLPHQRAPLGRRQPRIGQRPDQGIPEQRHLPSATGPGLPLPHRHQ